MRSLPYQKSFLAIVLAVGVTGATGCASKKYVRQQVDPVTGRVQQVESRTNENSGNITELRAGLSNTDERAQSAERLARTAGSDAARANEGVGRLGTEIEQTNTKIAGVERNLENRIETRIAGLNNYQMVSDDSVLFKVNRSELTKEHKQQLDEMAAKLQGMSRYVIEVQGFADPSGGTAYNVDLSERRANAVVRYLTTQHNVPLRNIHVLGVGEAPLGADERNTRDFRKQARRVQLKVFAPNMEQQPATTGQQTTGSPS